MRLFVQRSLTGLLTVAALGLSAVAAEAMGGNANGPDAYIGIIGGSPQKYNYSASGNVNGPDNWGYQANTDRGYPYGWGQYNGGYHNGY